MEKRAKENVEEFRKNMLSLISTLLPSGKNLSDFENLEAAIKAIENGSDEAAKAMVPFLRMMQEVISVSEGAVTVKPKDFNGGSFNDIVSDNEGYTSEVVAREKQLSVINAAQGYLAAGQRTTIKDKQGRIMTDENGNPITLSGYDGFVQALIQDNVFKSKEEAEQYFKNEDYAGNIFAAYK